MINGFRVYGEKMKKINTKIIHLGDGSDEENIKKNSHAFIQAGKIIAEGGLVAFPTETVYGIGANALDERATDKIYQAKGRPSDNPLIMHITRVEVLPLYVLRVSEVASQLIDAFWPGPLTLIFKKSDKVPSKITGGLDTVAIRMPKHPVARKIIEASGVPVAAPSANLSGKPSPTRGKHVIEDLDGRVDMIIDGGKAELGLESTVLDVSGDIPCILRPGSITRSMLEDIVGTVRYDEHLKDTTQVPKAPGMKYKHYAPKGKLQIVKGSDEQKIIEYINKESSRLEELGSRVGVISPEHIKGKFTSSIVESIGNIHNSTEIASNLFKLLRKMDELQAEYIFSLDYESDEVSIAVMNRLMKAAGHRIINMDEQM